MNRFLISNEPKYRLLRTIVQGIIGVFIANIDAIFGTMPIDPAVKPLIVGVVMAVLSPIMAALGTTEMDKEDLPEDFYEGGDEHVNGE